MQKKNYRPVVLDILRRAQARSILDAPCGTGWLGEALARDLPGVTHLDGLGLGEFPPTHLPYRQVREFDLNQPLLTPPEPYDAVVCGEFIHMQLNPGVLLDGFRRALRPGGRLIITTPNTWGMRARLQYLLRGFFPGMRPVLTRRPTDYVTYLPWSFPLLHLFLTTQGFDDVQLHDVDEPKPKYLAEHLLAWPGRLYCRRQCSRAGTELERAYWRQANSRQSVFGRWLVVSARRPDTAAPGRV